MMEPPADAPHLLTSEPENGAEIPRGYHTGEFLRLDRLLRRKGHFQLILAEHNSSTYRDQLLERLDQNEESSAVICVSKDDDVRSILDQLATVAAEHTVIHLTGLDAWFAADEGQALAALNQSRERIAEEVPVNLVFWLRSSMLRHLARNAPDFWAWRAGVFDFNLRDAPLETVYSDRVEYGSASLEDRNRRLRSIRAHLDSSARSHADIALLIEASEINHRIGEIEDSSADARKALEWARKFDDRLAAAEAWDRIADIAQARGDLDEALRIRENEQLPVYERLGEALWLAITKAKIADILRVRGDLNEALRVFQDDVLPRLIGLGAIREIAVTYGRIADILHARGELDKALRFREAEELPVFVRLGEEREIAITKSKIADILQARGDLDDALQVRKEEQLPILERLGEARLVAVTKGQIADILLARGELEEALRIREEEELPVYERLGAAYEVVIGKLKLALSFIARNAEGDREKAARLLRTSLDSARKQRVPEADTIAKILEDYEL